MRTKVSLCYDDVLLVPQFSDIRSRKEIDIGTTLGTGTRALELGMPIISSPMDTVTGPAMAEVMNVFGGLGIIHRYCTIDDQVKMVRAAKQNRYHSTKNDIHVNVGAAVGVTEGFEQRAIALHQAGVDFLCIDVATVTTLWCVKQSKPSGVLSAATNISWLATSQLLRELMIWQTGEQTLYAVTSVEDPSARQGFRPVTACPGYKLSLSVLRQTEMCRLLLTVESEIAETLLRR